MTGAVSPSAGDFSIGTTAPLWKQPRQGRVTQLIATADCDLHDGVERDVSFGLLRERSAGRTDLLAEAASTTYGCSWHTGPRHPTHPVAPVAVVP